jgi:hypothetical protein
MLLNTAGKSFRISIWDFNQKDLFLSSPQLHQAPRLLELHDRNNTCVCRVCTRLFAQKYSHHQSSRLLFKDYLLLSLEIAYIVILLYYYIVR